MFGALNSRVGNLPSMPGIFPDYPAPIVRSGAGRQEITMARLGMPSSQRALMDATRKRAQKLEARGKPADFKELLPDGAGQRHHEHPQREHASKKPTRTVTNLI